MATLSVNNNCTFCRIASGVLTSTLVFEDGASMAFLDHRPLFLGHCLLIPKEHIETLNDLPTHLIGSLFSNVKLLSRAVEVAMEAEGTFIAMNNRVSQSVPHLHVHIVPRRKKDGLKGFFWPRTKYKNEDELFQVQNQICSAIARLENKIATQKIKQTKI